MATINEMQDHLDELSSRLGCRLDQAPNMAGMMYVEFGYLEGPTLEEMPGHYPNAESRYLVCLHELGHYHYGHTQGRPWTPEYEAKAYGIVLEEHDNGFEYWDGSRETYFINGVLKSEAEAWNYALDKCIIPSDEIKPETRRFMWDTCLGSYFSNARAVGFDTPGQRLYNGDRGYATFAYERPDQYFFQTKRRIVEGDLPEETNNPEEELLNALEEIGTTEARDTITLTPPTVYLDNQVFTGEWITATTTPTWATYGNNHRRR